MAYMTIIDIFVYEYDPSPFGYVRGDPMSGGTMCTKNMI